MEWFLVSRTDPETVTTLSSDGFGNEVITSNGIPINQTEKYEQLKEMIKESSANVTELSSLLASDNLPWVSYSLDTDSSSISSGCTSSTTGGNSTSGFVSDLGVI